MATSYAAGPPERLRQRGLRFTKAQWQRFTPEQRRDIVRQSDALYRRTRREALTPAHRRQLARRRARYYAKKSPLSRREDWPEDESTEYWEGYRDFFSILPGERRVA